MSEHLAASSQRLRAAAQKIARKETRRLDFIANRSERTVTRQVVPGGMRKQIRRFKTGRLPVGNRA